MRIIAGAWRGRKLVAPKGQQTRPTADRTRETLFSMLASRLGSFEELRVADLYAGSGALGLEALSRGAAQCTLVENDRAAVEAIRGGGSLSSAFKRAGVFPPLLVYMTASGEASGQLDTMMERAADYLEREFDTFTATALSLLEPAIIVIMGAVVALIVLSILLPILQLDTLAGV